MTELPEAEREELRVQEVIAVLDEREQIAHYIPNCPYLSHDSERVADQLEIFERAKDHVRDHNWNSYGEEFEHLRDFPPPDVCIRIAPGISNQKARVLMLKLIEHLDEFRKPLVPPEGFATWSWNSASPAAPADAEVEAVLDRKT